MKYLPSNREDFLPPAIVLLTANLINNKLDLNLAIEYNLIYVNLDLFDVAVLEDYLTIKLEEFEIIPKIFDWFVSFFGYRTNPYKLSSSFFIAMSV